MVAKYSMPDAEPFTFLTVRMGTTVIVLIPFFYLIGQKLPRRWWQYRHDMAVGMLLHTCYLGAYFWAIRLGADAGTSAIIIGMQPIVTTAIAVSLLGESFNSRIGWGLVLGFLGISIVVMAQTGVNLNTGMNASAGHYLLPALSLLGVSLSLIYQKRYCSQSGSSLSSVWMQYVGALITCPIMALLVGETGQLEWTVPFTLAFIWQVGGLSIGAVMLLMWMVNHGEASRVSSLFYLVPPLVVIEAYFLFDETLSRWAYLGMAMTIIGVILARYQPKPVLSQAE